MESVADEVTTRNHACTASAAAGLCTSMLLISRHQRLHTFLVHFPHPCFWSPWSKHLLLAHTIYNKQVPFLFLLEFSENNGLFFVLLFFVSIFQFHFHSQFVDSCSFHPFILSIFRPVDDNLCVLVSPMYKKTIDFPWSLVFLLNLVLLPFVDSFVMASLSLCQFMFVLVHGRRIQFAVDVILHCAYTTTLSYSVRETLPKSIDATLVVMECETSVETLKWVVFFLWGGCSFSLRFLLLSFVLLTTTSVSSAASFWCVQRQSRLYPWCFVSCWVAIFQASSSWLVSRYVIDTVHALLSPRKKCTICSRLDSPLCIHNNTFLQCSFYSWDVLPKPIYIEPHL